MRGLGLTVSPWRPEAPQPLFGTEPASELGAPAASSIPEQLPGREPASTRKGYEDGNALFRWYRRVEGSFGHHGVARRAMFLVGNDAAGSAQLVEQLRGSSITAMVSRRVVATNVVGPGLACGRHVRAPDQSVQAAAIRQGQRDAGQERSARCAHDRIVRRRHADAPGTAAGADDRTAPQYLPSGASSVAEGRHREFVQIWKARCCNVFLAAGVAGLTADIDLLDQRLVEIVTADAALAHLITTLNAMLRDGTAWVDRYSGRRSRDDHTAAVALARPVQGHSPRSAGARSASLDARNRSRSPCDKMTVAHWITSSAPASSEGGTSRPSALAVLRLITNSNFVGACTGRSAGFSPLRMRST